MSASFWCLAGSFFAHLCSIIHSIEYDIGYRKPSACMSNLNFECVGCIVYGVVQRFIHSSLIVIRVLIFALLSIMISGIETECVRVNSEFWSIIQSVGYWVSIPSECVPVNSEFWMRRIFWCHPACHPEVHSSLIMIRLSSNLFIISTERNSEGTRPSYPRRE